MRSPIIFACLSFTVTSTLLLASCAQKEPETQDQSEAPAQEEEDSLDGMEMMQEFGGMDGEKVQKTLKRLYPSLSDCLMEGYKRVDFLAGSVGFLVKVNRRGKAEVAHAESSTLGDFETEQCMLETLEASAWPKPVGGLIGLARTSIAFDAPSDVRPPVEWSYDEVRDKVEDRRSDFIACGIEGEYTLTAYVATSGKVITAGIAHTDDQGADAAVCAIDTLKDITFDSPGSWAAKVTFSL